MKAYVFPGQAAQYEGMGKDMYEQHEKARVYFDRANDILGFNITDVMFEGSAEDLKQTKVTQPAVFLHSTIKILLEEDFQPDMVAGHSLGEFSALVANGCLSFEAGLGLVQKRADAMQKACEIQEGTMAAIIGLDDSIVEGICANIENIVIPANYNCPGQLVISGSIEGVEKAVVLCKEAGAKMAIVLPVGGAFHSSLMLPARTELELAINTTSFATPRCPIYQNVSGLAEMDPDKIKANLVAQLTAPVRFTQSLQNMIADGAKEFVEAGGNGKTIRSFLKRIDRKMPSSAL